MNRLSRLALHAGAGALLSLAALCASAQTAPATDTSASAPADDSLYVALGGQAGIARVVDDFVHRLAVGPKTSEFFKHSDTPHFREMLAQEFCQVSGGGCAYTGIPIKTAHQDMDITKGDFNAVVETLQDAMSAQGVPFPTQNRLLAKLAPLHREIVSVH